MIDMLKELLKYIFILFVTNSFAQNIIFPYDYFKADYYLKRNDTDSALIFLSKCNDSECIETKARIYFLLNDYNTALSLARQLERQNATKAYYLMSEIFACMGFAEESINYLQKYFDTKEPVPYSVIISNKCFYEISRTQEWRFFWQNLKYNRNYEQLLEIEYKINNENYIDLNILLNERFGSYEHIKFYLLAEIQRKYGNIDEAYKFVKESLTKKKNYLKALNLKYILEKEKRNYTSATKTKEEILKLDLYNSKHIKDYCEILYLTDRFKEALYYTNLYVDCYPDDEEILFLKAKILKDQNDLKNSIIVMNKILAQNTSKTDYFNFRGDLFYKLEMWDNALRDYTMSLDIDPYNSEIWKKTGDCYLNKQFLEKACYYWRKAATMKNNDAAQKLYKYCEF